MPVFEKLCQVAVKAHEKQLISRALAERVCAIGENRLHYKHLGLELHALAARLDPKAARVSEPDVESLVRHIEDRYRRL